MSYSIYSFYQGWNNICCRYIFMIKLLWNGLSVIHSFKFYFFSGILMQLKHILHFSWSPCVQYRCADCLHWNGMNTRPSVDPTGSEFVPANDVVHSMSGSSLLLLWCFPSNSFCLCIATNHYSCLRSGICITEWPRNTTWLAQQIFSTNPSICHNLVEVLFSIRLVINEDWCANRSAEQKFVNFSRFWIHI